jgi:hypothetical protein
MRSQKATTLVFILIILALTVGVVAMMLRAKAQVDRYQRQHQLITQEAIKLEAAYDDLQESFMEAEAKIIGLETIRYQYEMEELKNQYSEEELAQAVFAGCIFPASKIDADFQSKCEQLTATLLMTDQLPLNVATNPQAVEKWPETYIRILALMGDVS